MAVSLPFTHPSSRLTASEIIETLHLQPHPEGGHFRETFSDSAKVNGGRAACTVIYFLLQSSNFSALHRLDAAEAWHFYAGSPINIVELSADGPKVTRLGADLKNGERPQYVVPSWVWFGSCLADVGEKSGEEKWSLVGCTVAPGFLFEKFEMGERGKLLEEFPACKDWIGKLTRVQ